MRRRRLLLLHGDQDGQEVSEHLDSDSHNSKASEESLSGPDKEKENKDFVATA